MNHEEVKPHAAPMLDGAGLIAAERTRQTAEEGFLPAFDQLYNEDELTKAAACYLTPPWVRDKMCKKKGDEAGGADPLWPFHQSWWKPGDGSKEGRVRELVKAGALIAAEIDRLQAGGRK